MTEWIKRLQGYVKIRVWGFAPERFINLCSNKNILLWEIEKREDTYTMCVSLRSFYQLRPIARKTKGRGSHRNAPQRPEYWGTGETDTTEIFPGYLDFRTSGRDEAGH